MDGEYAICLLGRDPDGTERYGVIVKVRGEILSYRLLTRNQPKNAATLLAVDMTKRGRVTAKQAFMQAHVIAGDSGRI